MGKIIYMLVKKGIGTPLTSIFNLALYLPFTWDLSSSGVTFNIMIEQVEFFLFLIGLYLLFIP